MFVPVIAIKQHIKTIKMKHLKNDITAELSRLERIKNEILENLDVRYFEQIPVECIEEIAEFERACYDKNKVLGFLHRLESLENDFYRYHYQNVCEVI